VTAQKAVAWGTLISELTLSGNVTTTPNTHVAFFVGGTDGDVPCDDRGRELADLINQPGPIALGEGLVASCSFSHKPDPTYPDYYAKMSTYANMLLAYAQAIDPESTATTFPPIGTDSDEAPFRYLDSATSRARIGAVTDKLRVGKVVIVGLGGTGSYILDFVAKTPVREIHLYDHDTLLTHNAFRAPGAVSLPELERAPRKVDYFQGLYDAIHPRVIAHAVHVDASNVDELRSADFVFLAIDGGTGKRFIIEQLQEFGIPFADSGMGIYQAGNSLGGLVRTTSSTPGHTEHIWNRVSFTDGEDDEYDQNIQIVELNALNAVMAVVKWKKLLGFYTDFEHELSSTYTIDGNHLLNEDQAA